MADAEAMETLARKEVIHTNIRPDCGYLNTRLAKRKCELQFELNKIRNKKLSKGHLKSYSIFLRRKSPLCFYGYHFLDSLKSDMTWLSNEQAEELAKYLFRLKYVVPVMKYVREMSTTTVFYRYATDERIVAASLRQERIASSHIARVLMDRTPGIPVTGEKLLELLQEQYWSRDVKTHLQSSPRDYQLTSLCQRLLLHGYLVPVQEEQLPDRFQKFRRENSYYLCDSEARRDQVFQLMDDSSTITMEKNNNPSDATSKQNTMNGAEATETPTFARKEVIHTNVAPDCGYLNTRMAERKCELQFELNERIRKKKLSKGLLRSHSIFLQRKSPCCFFGYHFLDSLQSDMPWLSDEQAEELAEYLFRLKYVVPVMKYVREMSSTTVFYRYATDERIVAASLHQERIASSNLARVLMDRTPEILVTGDKLLELLDAHVQKSRSSEILITGGKLLELLRARDRSRDLETHVQSSPRDCQLFSLCQQMLLHGYLIPVQEEQAPERFQKFRRENSYYLCDSEAGRDQVFQLIDDSSTITTRTNNSVSNNSTDTTASKQTSIGGNCILTPYQSMRQARQPERHTGLTRSNSLTTRKISKAIVYWTMQVQTDGYRPKEKNEEIETIDSFQRTTSMIATDVEMIHLSQANNTYEPPVRRTSLPERVKVILKKLQDLRRSSTGRLRLLSISSIDAEWAVY